MKESSANMLPKSAVALYVKLYCQKRSKTNNRQHSLIEATKSWASLSKTEKQQFFNLFKEYNRKSKECFAKNLQNAQLYMKKKQVVVKRFCKNMAADCTSDTNIHKETVNKNIYPACNKDQHDDIDVQNEDELLENYSMVISPSNTCVNTVPEVTKRISEPVPPIRSSMELFEIIKHNDESTKNSNWSDLTKLQKQRYQRALLSIKKDYIKQYTAYLELLTPEQLFHYYKSQI